MMTGHEVRAALAKLGTATIACTVVSISLLLSADSAAQSFDQDRIKGVRRGGKLTFEPTGSGVLFGALDPAVKKWYVPQELFREYQWKQWEYSNYARDHYRRYLGITREGDYFYDIYGHYVTKGWLVYDWSQTQPQQGGSNLFKTEEFGSWFSNLVIASDAKGQHHLAITVGNEIRSTLTPMSFSKPAFDGIQVDYQSDKYEVTALLSRISSPGFAGERSPTVQQTTSSTTLTGGRATAQLGDAVTLGANYVSAHNSFQLLDAFEGSPRSGSIASSQNAENVTQVFVRLSDDSPEDNEGGATLFAWDLIIEAETERIDEEGNITFEKETVRASDVGLIPVPRGGFQRLGYWEASGSEQIELIYDFTIGSYTGPDPTEIRLVTHELVVANDYRIETTSNRQFDRQRANVYLLAARAEANVRDGSNLTVLKIPYGLPTATEIFGLTPGGYSPLGDRLLRRMGPQCQLQEVPQQGAHHAPRSLRRRRRLDSQRLEGCAPLFLLRRSVQNGRQLQHQCHHGQGERPISTTRTSRDSTMNWWTTTTTRTGTPTGRGYSRT